MSTASLTNRLGWRGMGLLVVVALLFLVYPLRNTIALRQLLLLVGLALSWSGPDAWRGRSLQGAGLAVIALTLWLCLQAGFFSLYPKEAFAALSADWLRGGLAAVLAWQTFQCLASRLEDDAWAGRLLLTTALVALIAHDMRVLVEQCLMWQREGVFPFNFPARDVWSGVNSAALALLIADFSSYRAGRSRLFAWPMAVSIGLILFALLMLFTLRTSNGTLVALGLIVIGGGAVIATGGLTARAVAVLGVAIAAGFAIFSADPRISSIQRNIEVSWDVDAHVDAWLHNKKEAWPELAPGVPVSDSIFLRVAWGHAALREIGSHPLGVGYGHRAFGYAVNKTYGTSYDIQSSHNGWLDFTLAGGVPAGLLLLTTAVLLIRFGWYAFSRRRQAAGLALILVVVDYLGRCAVDGHLSGARLEWFWLLAALAAATVARKQCRQ